MSLERIDNVLPQPLFEFVKEDIKHTAWDYIETTVDGGKEDTKSKDYSFAAAVFSDGEQLSYDSYLWVSVFYNLLDKFGFEYDDLVSLLRIRKGLIPNIGEEHVHGAHVDYDFKHYTILLYLDTVERGGETILYKNKRSQKWRDQFQQLESETLEVDQKAASIENSAILFDGLRFHSSSSPLDKNTRTAINFNFISKKSLTNL